jgi:hypothetical protein
MSPITAEIENSLNNLPEDIRGECIMAIKNRRNMQYCNNNQPNYLGNYNINQQNSGNEQTNKSQAKKKNKSSIAYEAVTCWFCSKKSNTQINCRSRLRQNKPLI